MMCSWPHFESEGFWNSEVTCCFTGLLKKGLKRLYVDGICSVVKEASCFK